MMAPCWQVIRCRALVPDGRRFSDEQMKMLIDRQVVLGTAFDSWMLCLGWIRDEASPQLIGIDAPACHISHLG